MQQTQVEYRNAIRALSDGEEAPLGFDIVTLDRKGKPVSGLSALMPGLRHRIAIHRSFHRSITNAAQRVKHFLEPQIFHTREKTEFNLHLRISVDRSRIVEIAQKHFDEVLEPEDLFFREFARLLLELLETSAKKETGSIDKRIGANRRPWQRELETTLSNRFGVGVEIIFDIEREVAADKIVRTEPGEYRHVYFRDRIDKTYPLMIDLRLRQLPSTLESVALPREEAKLKTNLFDMVARACEEDLMLSHYWFDADKMHEVVRQRLDTYLESYAHSIANLQIVRPNSEAGSPPTRSEKLNETIVWRDNRGYDLEFRAEAIAIIAENGAGLYDREGRPERSVWFNAAITQELKHRLAGVSIVDLDEHAVERHSMEVEKGITARAKEIGLNLDLFIGRTYLPNQKWNKPVIVPIAGRPYRTADPKIAGHFSMDIELSFDDRKAAETFMNEYHQSKLYGGTTQSGSDSGEWNALPDEFIQEKIIELAVEAATFEMQHIDPNDYFTDFVTQNRWEVAIPTLSAPGTRSGANVIRERICDTLTKRYPGVTLHNIHFHRADNDLEKLRRLIAALKPIEFECQIDDHFHMNAALDRKLKGYVFVESGDAERIVWMLYKDLDKLTPEAFTAQIRDHLTNFVQRKLFNASQEELNSLMESLTESGSTYDGTTRSALKTEIHNTIKKNFGLICGDVELRVLMSEDYVLLKNERRDSLLDPVRMNQLERASLKIQYEDLLAERAKVFGTTDEDIVHRNLLTAEIEEIKKRMNTRQEDASGRLGAPSSEHIAHASSLFSQRRGEERQGSRADQVNSQRQSPPDDIMDLTADGNDPL